MFNLLKNILASKSTRAKEYIIDDFRTYDYISTFSMLGKLFTIKQSYYPAYPYVHNRLYQPIKRIPPSPTVKIYIQEGDVTKAWNFMSSISLPINSHKIDAFIELELVQIDESHRYLQIHQLRSNHVLLDAIIGAIFHVGYLHHGNLQGETIVYGTPLVYNTMNFAVLSRPLLRWYAKNRITLGEPNSKYSPNLLSDSFKLIKYDW